MVLDYPVKQVHADGIAHAKYLKARHPPPETYEMRRKRKIFKKEIRDKLQIYDMKNLGEPNQFVVKIYFTDPP